MSGGPVQTLVEVGGQEILDAVKAELGAAWRETLTEEDKAVAIRLARRIAETRMRILWGPKYAEADGQHVRAQIDALSALAREAFAKVTLQVFQAAAETAGALLRGFIGASCGK